MADDTITIKALVLVLPMVLGALSARMGWLGELGAATRTLNGYALRVAFPALVCVGLLGSTSLGSSTWTQIVTLLGLWPVVLMVLLLAVRLCVGKTHRGSIGLVMVFGNVAYVGLPVVTLLWGEGMIGQASWLVSAHVICGVTLGAWWAARHGDRGGEKPGVDWGAVMGQPLLWAPVVGGALVMWGSEGVKTGASQLLGPIAKSAPPVALFMLGVYVWQQRGLFWRKPDVLLCAHLLMCLVVVPCVVAGAAYMCVQAGWMSVEMMRLHVMIAAMPVGITTFSMAYDASCSPERIAQAIVWSTTACVVTLPAWAWLLGV